MSRQSGIVHHFPLLSLLIIAALVLGAYLLLQGKLSLPFLQKGPRVEPETKYENPFKQETQYVNPFDSYKNPFTTNR